MLRILPQIVFVLAFGASCSKRAPPVAKEVFDVEPYQARAHVPALAYASFTRDHVVLVGAIGPADVTTPFEAASIAKLIVATTVMQAVDDKLVTLDDDVETYVGFPTRR